MAVIRNMAPVRLIMYYPETKEGTEALAQRIADVHASAVTRRIQSLHCHTKQKQALLDAIIATIKMRNRDPA